MTATVPAHTTALNTAVPPSTRARRHRRRILRGDLLTVACWVSAAMSVVLYLAQGVTITGIGDVIDAGGIIAGLLGTDLILVMLILAARIPLIDRTIGHDKALAAHRKLGKPAFYLLLAHGALLTLGYAAADGSNVITETVNLFGTPDLPLAYLSVGLFVAVIVTSLVAVRRKFPYEFWYVIHLLTYVAVLTALPHQFSQGSMLMQGTWQRVYWIALYVLALGSIATFRFIEPVIQSVRHRVVVDHVERIGTDAIAIHFRGHRLDKLRAEGGQFFSWRFWTPSTFWHAHPVSLSAATTSSTARITIRALGAGTEGLARTLRPGTPVSFEGPYGIFTDSARGRDRVAIFAAGIGITPARALLERLDAGPGKVSLIFRASDRDSLYHWDEIRELCDQRGWSAWTSLGPRGRGRNSWLADSDGKRGVSIDTVFPRLAQSEVYICGSDTWADVVESEATRRKVGAPHIHRERFDW